MFQVSYHCANLARLWSDQNAPQKCHRGLYDPPPLEFAYGIVYLWLNQMAVTFDLLHKLGLYLVLDDDTLTLLRHQPIDPLVNVFDAGGCSRPVLSSP